MKNLEKNLKISIIIATLGSAKYLDRTLLGLKRQTYKNFELILVDNNSKPKISHSLIKKYNFKSKLISNSYQNVCIARNFGLKYSTGQYIAFLDDDVFPTPQWLQNLLIGMETFHSDCIGGSVELKFESSPPSWLANELKLRRYLSELNYHKDINELKLPQYIVAANMMISREIIKKAGAFSEKLGRRKQWRLYAEETELMIRILKKGGCISFSKNALVYHYIDKKRATLIYLLKRAFKEGVSQAVIEDIHGPLLPQDPIRPLKNMFLIFFKYCSKLKWQLYLIEISRNLAYFLYKKIIKL